MKKIFRKLCTIVQSERLLPLMGEGSTSEILAELNSYNIRCAHQSLFKAYSKLSERGDCDSLCKVTPSINKEQAIIDLQRGQSVPSMSRDALIAKAQAHQQMMQSVSGDLIAVKGIFTPIPPKREVMVAAAEQIPRAR